MFLNLLHIFMEIRKKYIFFSDISQTFLSLISLDFDNRS